MTQTFGSALRCPWALVRFGSNSPVGRRPGTSVAYLTDDEGDHYLGGLVEFYRKRNTLSPGGSWNTPRWWYRYKHAKRIPKSDVLHIFPLDDKSPLGGPLKAEIRRARLALPVTEEEAAA
jgi:hypothetical protein